jgi:ribosomal-protein-alanine N-acetyltransferase
MVDPALYLTTRLAFRPPRDSDAPMLFERISSDPAVTRFVGWPRHLTVHDTKAFIAFSHAEWDRWPVGPLLIESRIDGALLGSTGLAFETPDRASTGYVLARDSWGAGIAAEALRAIVDLAQSVGIARLYALCHVDHVASMRVLERCVFRREGILSKHLIFPNLGTSAPQDVYCYARTLTRLD